MKLPTFLTENRFVKFWMNPINAKRAVLWQIFGVVAVLAVLALFFIVFDPCCRYGIPKFYDLVYEQPYNTIPGILRHAEYDTLILGASGSENYRISDTKIAFPDSVAVKATAAGVSTAVLKRFFDIALEARGPKLKRVINTVEPEMLFGYPGVFNTPMADCFYKRSHFYDYGYWWNWDIMTTQGKHVFYALAHAKKVSTDQEWDMMFNRLYKEKYFGYEELLKNVESFLPKQILIPNRYSNLEKNIENDYYNIAVENPGIDFVFVIPPYSAFYYDRHLMFGDFKAVMTIRTDFVKKMLPLKNVKIYDFAVCTDISEDFGNYRDLIHYHQKVNTFILHSLTSDKYRVHSVGDVLKNNAVVEKMARKIYPKYEESVKIVHKRLGLPLPVLKGL